MAAQIETLTLSEAVRKRPAMYFRENGPAAIPFIVLGIFDALLSRRLTSYPASANVTILKTAAGQSFTIRFNDFISIHFQPSQVEGWMKWLTGKEICQMYQLSHAAAASDKFEMIASSGNRTARLRIRGLDHRSKLTKTHGRAPYLQIGFVPSPQVFGCASHDEVFKTAGGIRDYAALIPGLATSLSAPDFQTHLAYSYPQGLKSLLFEEDHERWSAHTGCLSFQRSTKHLSVEGHLRFLHAGVPVVSNYVNFKPTQGGAHLEGLGDALQKMFPDSTRGCRELRFVTNPDAGAHVAVPHSFIGALHLRTDKPRFAGPTRDVLMGDDVREFVYKAAIAQLPDQWTRIQEERSRKLRA